MDAPTNLPEFLLACIAEDEAVARAATPGPWRYDPTKVNSVDRGEAVFAGRDGLAATTIASTGPADDAQSMADAAHIARHDPARVLAECKAKKEIVRQQQESERSAEGDDGGAWAAGMAYAGELAMRDMATAYAERPGYREEWRP